MTKPLRFSVNGFMKFEIVMLSYLALKIGQPRDSFRKTGLSAIHLKCPVPILEYGFAYTVGGFPIDIHGFRSDHEVYVRQALI